MKKYTIALLLTLLSTGYSFTKNTPIPERTFRYVDAPKGFFERMLPEAVHRIEYNPALRYYSHPTAEQWYKRCWNLPTPESLLWRDGRKHITIYLHGLFSPSYTAALEKYFLDTLSGCVASFNFIESSDVNWFDKVKYANVGQKIDSLIAIWVMAQVNNDCNPDVIHLYGTSRGGAATVIAEAILADTTDTYDNDLEQLGITPELRIELLTKIRRGARILNVPLTNMNRALERRMPNIPSTLKTRLIESITRYNPDGLHPDACAELVNPVGRKTFLYFEKHDALVGGKEDNKALWAPWVAKNPATTVVIEGHNGDNVGLGGHLHSLYGGTELLARELHRFCAQHNFPHNPERLRKTQAPCDQKDTPEEDRVCTHGVNLYNLFNARAINRHLPLCMQLYAEPGVSD